MTVRLIVVLLLFTNSVLAADFPRSVDPRVAVQLFAESPQIKTPTGIDVDSRGRVWAIESNTHFRPANYDGHATDRLLILVDEDGDGSCDNVKTFAVGFEHSMSVAVRPLWLKPVVLKDRSGTIKDASAESKAEGPGPTRDHSQLSPFAPPPLQVFLATRQAIWLLEDIDGDDVCDRRTELAWLKTKGNYPHNGLAGFAFDALGWMYFGFGENQGEPYELHSRELDDAHPLSLHGRRLTGAAEGGNIYRMRPDGTQLSFWANGFWNPHASCVDALGRLFTVDNDPDSRPPCRLMHVIRDGDYGYRFGNGRKGLHPFTSWNGEIPGTLPMVAGTGEAPSGILAYEHDALPETYVGRLFVTSWGDHRIDTFQLRPKGASFESIAEPLIVGGENFRPVGIALAPDGSLYCSDWVLADYQVHGRGRIWRIGPVTAKHPQDTAARHDSSAAQNTEVSVDQELHSKVLTRRRLAAQSLAKSPEGRARLTTIASQERQSDRARAEAAWALGQETFAARPPIHPVDALQSHDPFVLTDAINTILEGQHEIDIGDVVAKRLTAGDVNAVLLARRAFPRDAAFVSTALQSKSAIVRRLAVQWAAEEHMNQLRAQVTTVLKSQPMTTELFLATLAALEILDGKSPQEFDQTPAGKYVLPLLKGDTASPAVKAQALRLVDPTDADLTLNLLNALAASGDEQLQLEALRTLAFSRRPQALEQLASIVAAPHDSLSERDAIRFGEALLGLANTLDDPAGADRARTVLMDSLVPPGSEPHLASHLNQTLVAAIIRSLRHAAHDPAVRQAIREYAMTIAPQTVEKEFGATEIYQQTVLALGAEHVPDAVQQAFPSSALPDSDEKWRMVLGQDLTEDGSLGGAAGRGRFVFYHPHGPGCAKCHSVNGRGGSVGPDLSRIGASLTREKLIDSILEPSREVAPQFTAWNMTTTDGRSHVGMIVHENLGQTTLGDVEGKTHTLLTVDIQDRVPQRASIMPEKLEAMLTVREFHDLLAFLESLR